MSLDLSGSDHVPIDQHQLVTGLVFEHDAVIVANDFFACLANKTRSRVVDQQIAAFCILDEYGVAGA